MGFIDFPECTYTQKFSSHHHSKNVSKVFVSIIFKYLQNLNTYEETEPGKGKIRSYEEYRRSKKAQQI